MFVYCFICDVRIHGIESVCGKEDCFPLLLFSTSFMMGVCEACISIEIILLLLKSLRCKCMLQSLSNLDSVCLLIKSVTTEGFGYFAWEGK